ncbi:MAG: recombination regulator RecX [Oscillospiraceae bacterium]|nr:recombination regulator RecX [Oscillospiraceae bacterium]
MSGTALEAAVTLLSARLYSEKELEKKLSQKGYSDVDISYAMERLRNYRYIDDERYSAAVARHYIRKGYGRKRIRSEFIRRGIPQDCWDQAIADSGDAGPVLDAFLLRSLKNPDDPSELHRVSERLFRRGFSWQEIQAAINRFHETG